MRKNLKKIRKEFSLKHWRKKFNYSLDQYTEKNCRKIEIEIESLIDSLIDHIENNNQIEKISMFKKTVESLNILNEELGDMIETQEREELCKLFDIIAIAVGLNPAKYGKGEGIASEWRDW